MRERYVLYSVVGEEADGTEEGKQHEPDGALNAFRLKEGSGLRLSDVQDAFPLGRAFHFAFRNDLDVYVDLIDPNAHVPLCGNKIIARVTPLGLYDDILWN